MQITTLAGAQEWVAAWGCRPRPSILASALEGLRLVRSINAEYGHSNTDVDQAIAFLENQSTKDGE